MPRLRANILRFKARMPRGVKLMFVVKGNAYGHGAVACASAAERGRAADWFGVSSVEEGVALREAGVRLPILVLGSLYPFESFLAAAEYGLTATVASLESAQRLAEVSRRLGRPVGCHLKIETGMGRIGVTAPSALEVLDFLATQKAVSLTGIYTHFSCAETSRAFSKAQLARFKGLLADFTRRRPSYPRHSRGEILRHAANSAAALHYPASRLDMVRPGLALYGLYEDFDPVLSLKTKVVFLKNVPKGAPIGYGAAFRARRSSRIATLPIGYADGVFRGLAKKGLALLGGRPCRIVAVTMDMIMLDATDCPQARVGDHVVLIGSQGAHNISASDIAKILNTIPYEVTTAISSRVPRVYRP